MKVRIGRHLLLLLVCSLLQHTVLADVRLGRRQDPGTYVPLVTTTVTVFTQFTVTETATVTVTPARGVTTTTSTARTTTTCVSVGVRRRDDSDSGTATTTSTTTVWRFPDATETLTVTATDLQSAAATRVVTEVEVEVVTATATAAARLPIPPPDGSDVNKPGPLAVVVKEEPVHGVHLAVVLGAVFGGVVGAIALFVAGFLWMKKREEKILELEEVAGSVPPRGGGGGGGRVVGLLGSVLGSTRSSTHYNTIPEAAMFRQLPPQLPPVDLDPPAFDLHYDSMSPPLYPASSVRGGYAPAQADGPPPAFDAGRPSLAVEP